MKTIILSCGIGLFFAVISLGDAGQIAQAENKTFFPDVPKRTRATVLPHLDPQSEAPLVVNQNSNIVAVFSWWLNRALAPSCVPSVEFIAQNIHLYPANEQHSEDIASLSFAIGDNRYQVLQTGGLRARFYVLVDTGKTKDADANHAKTSVEGMINSTLRSKAETKSATVSLVSSNGVFIGIGDFEGIPVQCLTDGKEICVSVSKTPFEETVPAHEPMPNEWFAWERGKARPRNTE